MERSNILLLIIIAAVAGIILIFGVVLPFLAPILPAWIGFFQIVLAPVSEPPMSTIFIVGLSLSVTVMV